MHFLQQRCIFPEKKVVSSGNTIFYCPQFDLRQDVMGVNCKYLILIGKKITLLHFLKLCSKIYITVELRTQNAVQRFFFISQSSLNPLILFAVASMSRQNAYGHHCILLTLSNLVF